jgi:hypothetical protein
MIEQAILTESVKTDIRSSDEQILDNLLERQKRQDKEPRSQFFRLIYQQSMNTVYFNDIALSPLITDNQGFLKLNENDFDYPAPNTSPVFYNVLSSNYQDFNFSSLSNISLLANINWFRRQNVVSNPTNFSFNLWLCVAEINNSNQQILTNNDYSPLLKINLGTVNYVASSNTFTNINHRKVSDLSNFVINQNFGGEQLQITSTQYDRIKNGESRLSTWIGFDTATVSAGNKSFLYNRPFILNADIQLAYKGLSKL